MIHGLVDRPLTFTMEDLKRLPSVTRLHFIECAGNRSSRRAKTVQETHGMTSCAEWTGVLLSTLLKECGVKGGASWFVAEGAEEVKGASSMPIAKAMDDCHRGLRHERRGGAAAERVSAAADGPRLRRHLPHEVAAANQAGGPVLHELQRLRASRSGPESRGAGLPDRTEIGHHVPVRRTTAARQGFLRDQRPGLVRWRRHSSRWRSPPTAARTGTTPRFKGTPQRMAHTRFGYQWNWDGNETELLSRCTDEIGQVQPSRAQVAKYWNMPFDAVIQRAGAGQHHSAVEDRQRWERDQWASLRVLPFAFALLMGVSALAQAPTYGVGRTPTAEEIRAWDISIGPTGEELPPGRGTAKEGAQLYRAKGCAGCHGATGIGGTAPILKSKAGPECRHLGTGANTAAPLAVRDDGVGLHQSRACLSIERGR